MDEERIEVPSEVIDEGKPFIPEPTTMPSAAAGAAATSDSDKKIDKAADMFVTIILTLGQLILAAILVTFGLSIIPIVTFTCKNILKVFCLLIGVKFVVAGYQVKKL